MKNKKLQLGFLSVLIVILVLGCGISKETSKPVEPTASPVAPTASQVVPTSTQIPPTMTAEPEPTIDVSEVYGELLDHYYELVSTGGEYYNAGAGDVGVWEAIAGKETTEALNHIGYAVQDISGDGIPELLIGAIVKKDGESYFGSETFAVFTNANEELNLSFEGWARSSYFYSGGGNFFHLGSSGAMYSVFGSYTLFPDGKSLSCNDFYFTYEKDASFQEVGFYHNTTGEMDKAVSEELKITAEEFWQKRDRLGEQVQVIELIPFSKYKAQYESTNAAGSPVRVQWAEDVLPGLAVYDEFIADTSDGQVKVVFSTDSRVTDFKVLALTFESADENGNVSFAKQELYAVNALTSERPLVVGMTFFGDLPSYGISYVDENGVTRNFALGLSGMDGSLLLTEF